MEQLLYQHFAQASVGHTASMVAEADTPEPVRVADSQRRTGPAPLPPVRDAAAKADMEAESVAEGEGDDETGDAAPARQAKPTPLPPAAVAQAASPAQPVRPV